MDLKLYAIWDHWNFYTTGNCMYNNGAKHTGLIAHWDQTHFETKHTLGLNTLWGQTYFQGCMLKKDITQYSVSTPKMHFYVAY